MIESVYITLIILAFIMLTTSFFIRTEQGKFGQQVILLGISAVLFGSLAAASFNVEVYTCSSTNCTLVSSIFEDNAWIFGSFALITGVLTLIKSFDAFNFTRNKT